MARPRPFTQGMTLPRTRSTVSRFSVSTGFLIASAVLVTLPVASPAHAVNPARYFQKHHGLYEERERERREEAEARREAERQAALAEEAESEAAEGVAVADEDDGGGFFSWLGRRLGFGDEPTAEAVEATASSTSETPASAVVGHEVVRPTAVVLASPESTATGLSSPKLMLPLHTDRPLNGLIQLRHDRFLGLLMASGLEDELGAPSGDGPAERWVLYSVDNATLDAMNQQRLRTLLADREALRDVLRRHVETVPAEATSSASAGEIRSADRLRMDAEPTTSQALNAPRSASVPADAGS